MLTSSGTTKRLDHLERAGLIARGPDPDDRRGTLITLTPAGRELIDRATEAHLANEARLLAALPRADRQALAGLLRRLQLGLPDT
jgi:DNA-binding MarR family transcriptional regulator